MPIKTSRFDVDIISQTLAEVIQRPRLGTINIGDVSGAVAANTANLIMSISGAGIHWGVYFWLTSTATQDNDYIRVVADGNSINLPTVKQLLDNNFIIPIGAEAFITLYDAVNFKYAGGGGAGKTWNTSYKLYYVETHGRTPTANLKYIYSLF